MKFIHLSDLHIGKVVNGFSMIQEQQHAFVQILDYIKKEKPSAVLIAGDVFDKAMPTVEAINVFDDFLTELSNSGAAVLLISGNHDSADRLNFGSRLFKDKNIHLCSIYDSAIKRVTLKDNLGDVNFYLLPFIKPSLFRGLDNSSNIETYDDAFANALATIKVDYKARNVLMAHQFFIKADVKLELCEESERNLVGGLDCIDITPVEKFDYVALGHLHRAQKLFSEHIRYCGSPIKYSLSEAAHEKSITLVELKEKGNLIVTKLPLVPICDMREIRGKLEELLNKKVYSKGNRNDYLKVILTDEEELLNPMDRVRAVYKNAMVLSFENSKTNIDLSNLSISSEQYEKLSPLELFSEFYLYAYGSAMTSEQAKLMLDLIDGEDYSKSS